MNTPPHSLHETHLKSLERVHRGKVRDVYAIDDERLLIVATDRLSAFDVILPDPIPGKGRILNSISNFWFERTRHIVPNHLLATPLAQVLPDAGRARAGGGPLRGGPAPARRCPSKPWCAAT